MHPKEAVQHRDSRLRRLQNIVAPIIPGVIGILDRAGAFPGTRIHEARINKTKKMNADDITLSQLQMTAHTCQMIRLKKYFSTFSFEYLLTSLLNGADGPVARRMGTESPEGGIKDAAVDRLSEVMIARLITQEIGLSDELSHQLQVAFQISTLTKAACEMAGAKTSEGGLGSMIERRMTLYFILKDLINLNKIPDTRKIKRARLKADIDQRIENLVDNSFQRAKDRINQIESSDQLYRKKILNDSLNDADSAAGAEARKYAGIVKLNERIGIDIIKELDKLTEGRIEFPSVSELENYGHIKESLKNAQGFLDSALEIASPHL